MTVRDATASLVAAILQAAFDMGRSRGSKRGITWAQVDTLVEAVRRHDDASGPVVPLAVTCPCCGADYEEARAKNARFGRAVPVSNCPNSRHGHSRGWAKGDSCSWCGQRKSEGT